jgi:hypothetical protein
MARLLDACLLPASLSWIESLDSMSHVGERGWQAFVTGLTGSPDFPTVNALQPVYGANPAYFGDTFVVKLAAGGLTLDYSTFLGGSGNDLGTSRRGRG